MKFSLCCAVVLAFVSAVIAQNDTKPTKSSMHIKMKCTSDYMEASIDRSVVGSLDSSKLHLRDANCKSTEVTKDYIIFRTQLDGCGTTHNISADGKYLVYYNSITGEMVSPTTNTLITREHQSEMPFQCSYERRVVLSVHAYSPRRGKVYTSTEEFGNFTFTMDMYDNKDYEKAYDDKDYPVSIGIGQRLYLEVTVKNQGNSSALSVVPVMCKATPTEGYDDKPQYVFINESCATDKTIKYDFKESGVQRFSMAAFRFLPDYKNVYFHCKVTACPKGDSNSRCAVGCKNSGGNRRRREAPTRDIEFEMAVGPVSLKSEQKAIAPQASKAAPFSMITMVTIIAGILGVVVLALIIGVFVVVKLKQPAHKPQKLLVTDEA